MADGGTVTVRLPFVPRKHQREAHRARKRFSVLVWHRRAGKTVFAVGELVLAALRCARERGRYAYVAPLLNQAKGVAWDYLQAFTRDIPGVRFNQSELWVELPNGARIRIYGADNPDALRGLYFDGVVLDEVADMRPQVWGEIIRPALADREGWALFIGTPKGVNLFSELYYAALKDETWHAEVRRAADTGALSEAELDDMRRTLSVSQWAQEVECDFAAAVDNVLVRLDEVLEAQRRTPTLAAYEAFPRILGVDVARYGDDRTVLFPRQGPAAMRPRAFQGLDTMAVAAQVAQSIEKWHPHAVFVDQGGIGAGVVDRLRQLGHQVVGVDFGGRAGDARMENKRAEMWWTMAEWIREGGCLPDDTVLAGELTAPTYTYANKRGRLQLESKDDLRQRGLPSPDIADALALTFALPVAMPATGIHALGERRAAVDYDPFGNR